MKEIEGVFTTAVAELESLLNTRTVVGEPIQVGSATVIPLVSMGFGFGVGGGTGKAGKEAEGEGYGGGTGGGGGVKPVAIIVSDDGGVRVENVGKRSGKVLEKAVETFGEVARSAVDKREREKAEGSEGDEA
jgi:uncharacterized spore protein YtfJ